jgi:hypothetical protein
MLIIIIIIIILLKKYLIIHNILIKRCYDSYDLKTGDIILFKNYNDNIFDTLITTFTHVGIVIKSDKLYILESHKLEYVLNYYTSGINLYDLKERINTYNGNTYLLRLKKEISNQNEILEKINKYKTDFKYPKNYKKYYISECFFNINKYNRNDNKLLCSEFIYYVLLDNNIISNDNKYLCMKPSDYIYLDEYEYCGLIKI